MARLGSYAGYLGTSRGGIGFSLPSRNGFKRETLFSFRRFFVVRDRDRLHGPPFHWLYQPLYPRGIAGTLFWNQFCRLGFGANCFGDLGLPLGGERGAGL